mmetsp:Transcript_6007/g.7333  ORF Transcript_6007/g.7333 Transcript_6007/m.7333 type:complete len:276 (+) Transcript_6007:107-934(+)|eukprot:jgi/Bigna1/86591/estExt_fgenesh1_pg.C_120027
MRRVFYFLASLILMPYIKAHGKRIVHLPSLHSLSRTRYRQHSYSGSRSFHDTDDRLLRHRGSPTTQELPQRILLHSYSPLAHTSACHYHHRPRHHQQQQQQHFLLTKRNRGRKAVVVSVWDSSKDVGLEYWKGWMTSCRMGDVAFVRAAINYGIDIEQLDDEIEPGRGKGRTGLQEAAARGHIEVVKVLLENNPCVDHQDYWNGRTPLMEAAKGGHAEVVMLLIKYGASTELRDFEGMTAYDWADQYNKKVDVENQIKLWKKLSYLDDDNKREEQ